MCVRGVPGARPAVSPFLPHPTVVSAAMGHLGLVDTGDPFANEIALARALDYEPMFMTDCSGLIFPWEEDTAASDESTVVSTLVAGGKRWTRKTSRSLGEWGDDTGFPVRTEADHELILAACEEVPRRREAIRAYFRSFRARVGEGGVIVIGHPHVSWLGYQVSQQNLVFHFSDFPRTCRRSMDAIHGAALVVFEIALAEGIDFMSESCSGLEMTSPEAFREIDLPILESLSSWTHARGALFWYHNCGLTRRLILDGTFNRFRPDVLETIAPPPEGDNDLAESRRALDAAICTKGNLGLTLLRDGTPGEVERATRRMVAAVRGFRHVHSTADAVLPGTPAANFIAFVRAAREETSRG